LKGWLALRIKRKNYFKKFGRLEKSITFAARLNYNERKRKTEQPVI
jgi:hypothetical protein